MPIMTVFQNMIGHRINGIFLANYDSTLLVRTTAGKWFRYDTANECVNTVWITHISGIDCLRGDNIFSLLRGALVTGGEDKDWRDNNFDGGVWNVIKDGFYTLHTDHGYIDIEVRNSSVGYYGGSFAEYHNHGNINFLQLTDIRQITQDF